MGENCYYSWFYTPLLPPFLFAQLLPPPPSGPSLHQSWDQGTLLDSLYIDFSAADMKQQQ